MIFIADESKLRALAIDPDRRMKNKGFDLRDAR
jgi:hypothetical protein